MSRNPLGRTRAPLQPPPNKAAPSPTWTYFGRVARVIDGDTFQCWVDRGQDDWGKVKVRVAGVDAPEVTGDTNIEGRQAAQWTHHLLVPGDERAWTYRGKREADASQTRRLIVETIEQDTQLGRWISNVWFEDDDGGWKDLAAALIESGHGVLIPS